MKISASVLLCCVLATATAYPIVNERLAPFRGPEVVYESMPFRPTTIVPETVVVQEHIVERPVFEEVHKLPKFGYDNYGNAIPEHPFAYINDAQGTRAIEDATTVRSAPAVVPTTIVEPVRPVIATPRPFVQAAPEVIFPHQRVVPELVEVIEPTKVVISP